jgi:hypothetical protein
VQALRICATISSESQAWLDTDSSNTPIIVRARATRDRENVKIDFMI